jgi:uncharacterized protein YjlB
MYGYMPGECKNYPGRPRGKKVELTQGDVIILPAGVGHKCLHASNNFLCMGAYPQGKEYDIN